MKAIKVRIYPTKEQAYFLNGQFGAVRMVYNKALAIISNRYKKHNQSISTFALKKLLPIAKRSRKYHWLKEYDSIALQQAIINLDKGFKGFFSKQSKYPRFKKRYGKQSSYHCSNVSYGESYIKIPKLGKIKAKIHREIPTDILN